MRALRFSILLIAATALHAQTLQFGPERPLIADPVIAPSAERAYPDAAIAVGNEHAVIWHDAPTYGAGRVYVTWSGAATGVPTGTLGTYESIAGAASDGTNVAIAYPAHVDVLHRDGSVTVNSRKTAGNVRQIASNGNGYILDHDGVLEALDADGRATGRTLAIKSTPRILIAIGSRYLFITEDIFGAGAYPLDEQRMQLGARIDIPRRGPDATLVDAVASPHGFAILWLEPQSASRGTLWATQFDANAQIVTPATLVAPEANTTSRIAVNGSGYAVLAMKTVNTYINEPNAYAIDGSIVRAVPLSTRTTTRDRGAISGSESGALFVWGEDSQVHATSAIPLRRRIPAEAIVSLRARDQLAPRVVVAGNTTYAAWLEHGDHDLLFLTTITSGVRSKVERFDFRPDPQPVRLYDLSLTTNGVDLFVTWRDGDAHTGVALVDRELHVVKQTSFSSYGSPIAFVDGTSLVVVTRATGGPSGYVVHRFSSTLADLGVETFTTALPNIGSIAYTGNDYVLAYQWSYPLGERGSILAIGYARMPKLDWNPQTTIRHDAVVFTYSTIPAIAASPSSVLFSGNTRAVVSHAVGDFVTDETRRSVQPHAIWHPAGWFLLTNGGTITKLNEKGQYLGVASLGDTVTESIAVPAGSEATLLYTRDGRIYVRSMQ